MGHYTKLGVLALRSFGLIILLYAVPIVIYGVLRMAFGAPEEPDTGRESEALGALLQWMIYMFAGVLLVKLARPLARIAARGLDESGSGPPAA